MSLKTAFMLSLAGVEFSSRVIPVMKWELASSHAQSTAFPS